MTTLEANTQSNSNSCDFDTQNPTPPLRESVKLAVETYFNQLDGQPTFELYNMVMSEVEEPLLIAVMNYTKGNQSKAAQILGLSRGTLRKKLETYDLL